jgi:putative acetyltransferase
MDPIEISPERADHPQVIALLDALDRYLGALYPPEANHILGVEALLQPDVHFLVARRAARVVGCAATRRMPAEAATAGRAFVEVKRMMVDPAHRGQRIGEQLLQRLEQAAAAEGVDQALLETGAEQRGAVRLYERSGYRRRGAFAGYPDNGLSLFYEKRLALPVP